MRRTVLLLPAFGVVVLGACSDGFEESTADLRVTPIFSPSTGALPVPNDLLYSGSSDGTLSIPVEDASDLSDPSVALNALTGWSTAAPFVIEFDGPVDVSSAVIGDTVRLFRVTTLTVPGQPVGTPVTGIEEELDDTTFRVEGAAEDASGATLRVTLLDRLQEASTYMVVVTDGLLGEDGRRVGRSAEYSLASYEEPYADNHPFADLRDLVDAMQSVAAAAGIERDTIVLSYSFTTVAGGSTLSNLRLIAGDPSGTTESAIIAGLCGQLPSGCASEDTDPDPLSPPSVDVPDTRLGSTANFLGAGPGLADVYQGGLTLPSYLAPGSNTSDTAASNDTTVLGTRWTARFAFTPGDTDRNVTRFNPLPVTQGQEQIPVLVTVPNTGAPPAAGWPVVIFQHGVTRERGDLLLIADALAAQGLAAVAIDMPLHGLAVSNTLPSLDALFEGYLDGSLRERTYGLDLVDNGTGTPGPDGMVDPSGTHYVNLANLQAVRDNLRQSIVDLFQLEAVLGDVDVIDNGTGAPGADAIGDFDLDRVHFVGHSLGGIVGAGYLALGDEVVSASLPMPGMGLPYLLDASPTFGPTVQGGLAARGVSPGTPDYAAFLFAAQAVVEVGDALAFTDDLAASSLPLHLIEVVGGGAGGGLEDQTVPNTVEGAPLSGTEPMITALELASIASTTFDGGGVRGAVRFVEGTHASILSPGSSMAEAAAYLEMQLQTALFASNSGTEITVTDGSVLTTP